MFYLGLHTICIQYAAICFLSSSKVYFAEDKITLWAAYNLAHNWSYELVDFRAFYLMISCYIFLGLVIVSCMLCFQLSSAFLVSLCIFVDYIVSDR